MSTVPSVRSSVSNPIGDVPDSKSKLKRTSSHSLGKEDEIQIDEDEFLTELEEKVVPPDGGWGWVIVVVSFLCNLIVDGTIYSFGELVAPIHAETTVKKLNVSITAISWIGSLCSGFSVIGGPVVSLLTNRFGFRAMIISGSLVSSVGFAVAWTICYFLDHPDMATLYMLYGVVGGFGMGMIYVPAIVAVGFYFDKRRGIASGIAVCGSGVGTFIYPPIINCIMLGYNWRGVLLFLSVMILSCAILGLFVRPIKPIFVPRGFVHQTITRSSAASINGVALLMTVNTTRGSVGSNDIKNFKNNRRESVGGESVRSAQKSVHSSQSIQSKRPSVNSNSAQPQGISSQRSVRTVGSQNRRISLVGSIASGDQIRTKRASSNAYDGSSTKFGKRRSCLSRQYEIDEPLDEVDEDPDFKPAIIVPIPTATSCLWKTTQQLCDCQLLGSKAFQLLALSSFLNHFGSFIPFVFLKSIALENMDPPVDSSAATFILSLIGIGNLIGRLGAGYIADLPRVNPLILNNVSLTLQGLSILPMPFLNKYWQFLCFSAIYGVASGSAAGLRAIVLLQLLPLEKLTNGFGLVLMMYGFGIILGLPFGAFLHEVTEGYSWPFGISGGSVILSGILCYPLLYVKKRWDDPREERKSSTTSEIKPE